MPDLFLFLGVQNVFGVRNFCCCPDFLASGYVRVLVFILRTCACAFQNRPIKLKFETDTNYNVEVATKENVYMTNTDKY